MKHIVRGFAAVGLWTFALLSGTPLEISAKFLMIGLLVGVCVAIGSMWEGWSNDR